MTLAGYLVPCQVLCTFKRFVSFHNCMTRNSQAARRKRYFRKEVQIELTLLGHLVRQWMSTKIAKAGFLEWRPRR
jgi:hypothetical protein